jgi:hypothetical protein
MILVSRHVPLTDPWSINTQGFPWLNSSWGWDCIAWIMYRYTGLTGLLCITALLCAALVRLVTSIAETAGAKAAVAIPVGIWMLLALLTYELPEAPVSIAPQTTTLVLLVLLQLRLERDDQRQPWWGPLLLVLWANLHGGFVAGQLAIIVAVAARLLRVGRIGIAREALLAGACLVAPVVSPYGFDNYLYVIRHLSSPASEVIFEWQGYALSQSVLASTFIIAFVASVVVAGVRRHHALVVQAIVWLGFGLDHQRNIALFLVSAAPLLAIAGSSFLRTDMQPLVPQRIARTAFAMLVLASPAIVRSQFANRVEWPAQMYPKQEIAYLVDHLRGRRLYNHWNFGSYIIFDAAGRVPVFIDGRGATAYPPELLQEMRDLSLPQILDKHRIDVALIPLNAQELVAELDARSEWERELTGESGVIYRRRNGSGL